ncbi:MAG: radical SAM protein [Verrucomicrobia bacterium]|jgi:7-carboxy-7-deazaguanine synthase|nr:radical SAM protein [Verrucomicrobiota bacterium]
MGTVDIAERFVSIQGESSYAGLGCFFIRLAGCNLRCTYCDTPGGLCAGQQQVDIASILEEARKSRMPLIEVTGGEPLLQESFPELVGELLSLVGKTVLVETNGSLDTSVIPEGAVAIVDVKCPGSGEGNSFDLMNLKRLRPRDELKFVLSGRGDYEWARAFVQEHGLFNLENGIHFSPVSGELDAAQLGAWILEDGLPVRLQLQLHKLVGMA